jgi:hypothetical protein
VAAYYFFSESGKYTVGLLEVAAFIIGGRFFRQHALLQDDTTEWPASFASYQS